MPTSAGIHDLPLRRANEMMLLDTSCTLFLTHVGSLTTVKSNQRRFAPTPTHVTGIRTLCGNRISLEDWEKGFRVSCDYRNRFN